jgi:DNA-binding MarR family transcriptional regulator
MPTSKLSTRSAETGAYVAPFSVSTPSLLRAGNDRSFQKLIFDLFTISARIERVRAHFASKEGITGPQYSILRAVASLQGNEGISIGAVAEHLKVTSPFVTAQSGLLTRLGFLKKGEDRSDRRISRLSLTPRGQKVVDRILEGVRPVNDAFFGKLERSEFIALSTIMAHLVVSSTNAIAQISFAGSDHPAE